MSHTPSHTDYYEATYVLFDTVEQKYLKIGVSWSVDEWLVFKTASVTRLYCGLYHNGGAHDNLYGVNWDNVIVLPLLGRRVPDFTSAVLMGNWGDA